MLKVKSNDGEVSIKSKGDVTTQMADLMCICAAVLRTTGKGFSGYMTFLHFATESAFLEGVLNGGTDNEDDI